MKRMIVFIDKNKLVGVITTKKNEVDANYYQVID